MLDEAWSRLLQKLAESPELRAEFTELALRHGIDFSAGDGELSEDDLEGVAGGGGSGTDAGQFANIDLQSALQKEQQLVQMMSNLSRMMHDTTLGIIRNIR